jgi:hypothetical protein
MRIVLITFAFDFGFFVLLWHIQPLPCRQQENDARSSFDEQVLVDMAVGNYNVLSADGKLAVLHALGLQRDTGTKTAATHSNSRRRSSVAEVAEELSLGRKVALDQDGIFLHRSASNPSLSDSLS